MTVAQPDEIDFILADLDLYTRAEIVALAVNIDANLRDSPPLGTPVDTGWARANWVSSIGAPYSSGSNPKHPTAGEVSAQENEQTQGLNSVLGWRVDDGPIYITNNVPYIGALNAGHSSQSPPGFVQAAIEQGIKDTYSAGASKAARFRRADTAKANKRRPK